MSTKYKVGERLDIKIEKVVPGGYGLGFAEKLTVLVPLAAVGDHLRVQITYLKKRLAFAEIVDVAEPSNLRIEPPCPYFGTCGGCDFQQMSYPAQLVAKVAMIRDSLQRIGKIDYSDDIAVIASPHDFGYRSRARFHLDPESNAIGFFARDSHNVIDITHCPILTPGMQSTLEYLRENVDWLMIGPEGAEVEAVSDGEHVSIFSRELIEPNTEISVEAAGERYAFTAETFFQANRFLIDALVEAAIGGATGKTALDLYCGVGLFALPLGRRFERVIGVEGNPTSIAFAKQNAARAELENVSFVSTGVGEFLEGHDLANTDFVLLDPPRSGPEKYTVASIARIKPAEISYVSCDPAILARDLRELLDAGYVIQKITAIDLFPQTHHVETVVRLKLS